MRKTKNTATQVYARIYDEETATKMRRLVAMGDYHSMSEIVLKCIDLALPMLTGERKAARAEKEYDVERAIKQQTATLRDLSVQSTMMFNLVVGLFRERELMLNGTQTDGQDLAEGRYEILSEYYQDRMNELMKLV